MKCFMKRILLAFILCCGLYMNSAHSIITPVRTALPPNPGDVQYVTFDYPITTDNGTPLTYADSPAVVVMVANTSHAVRPVAHVRLLDGSLYYDFDVLTSQRCTENPPYAHSGIWIMYRDKLVYKNTTRIEVRFTGGTGGHIHVFARTFTGIDPGGTTANNGYKIDTGTGHLFGEIAMTSGRNGSLMLDCLSIRNGSDTITPIGAEETLWISRRDSNQTAMGETENIL